MTMKYAKLQSDDFAINTLINSFNSQSIYYWLLTTRTKPL